MHCNNCGEFVANDVGFCNSCGNRVSMGNAGCVVDKPNKGLNILS